jgi:outer membrane protein OmpA-like peptidoglycan-associated protein
MRITWPALAVAVMLTGCSALFGGQQKYSLYFEPYSVALDQQAQETVRSAARYAADHPLVKVSVAGYAAPPDRMHDVDGLSAQRAAAVKQALIGGGVAPDRIATEANGVTDPKMLPALAERRVDITEDR